MKPIVWRSVFLGIIAGGCVFLSIMHYYFNYRDISQLITFLILSAGILYVAYDQWYKITRVKEIKESISWIKEEVNELHKAMDVMNNTIQNKIFKLQEVKNERTTNS